MAHAPTSKMITSPHIEVKEHCMNCTHMNRALAQDKVDWGTIRNACRCCKTGSSGIYKADAIYDFLKLYLKVNSNLTPGRKATRHKTHGQTVRTLRSKGYSLQDIRHTTGLAINTIRTILKEGEPHD
jgi:hypothetical protein